MIDKDNTRAEKDRVNLPEPLSAPGNAEPAKVNTVKPADVRPWVEGTGLKPPVISFGTDGPMMPNHLPPENNDTDK